MEHEKAGGPLKVAVDLFVILLILAAFTMSIIFFVRNLNTGNAALEQTSLLPESRQIVDLIAQLV